MGVRRSHRLVLLLDGPGQEAGEDDADELQEGDAAAHAAHRRHVVADQLLEGVQAAGGVDDLGNLRANIVGCNEVWGSDSGGNINCGTTYWRIDCLSIACLLVGHGEDVFAAALNVGETAGVGHGVVGPREGRVGPVLVLLGAAAIHLRIERLRRIKSTISESLHDWH